MRFGMYFKIILNKNGYFHVEIHTNYSCTHKLASSGLAYGSSPEKILKIWCNLVRFEVYFDQMVY